MKAGAEDFLTKPPRKEDLLAAVARALARDAAAFETTLISVSFISVLNRSRRANAKSSRTSSPEN